jgi:phosphatidylglycerophosphatase A
VLFIPIHVLVPSPFVGIPVVLAVVLSFPLCNWASAYMGQWDPQNVVLDELAGQWVTFWPAFWMAHWPNIWWALAAGFFLFRFFDVTKFFPANLFDGMEWRFAVVVDDLVAGVYANLALTALGWWYF